MSAGLLLQALPWAASFALLVYASAWLKRHHPGIFACALLNSQPMGFYAPAQIVRDAIASLKYVDPATLTPPPPVRTGETVWFEDAFPEKAKVEHSGNPTTFVEASQGPVHSGKRALKRTAKGVAQDFFANGAAFVIPPNGVITVWTYLDPANLPKSPTLAATARNWLTASSAIWPERREFERGLVAIMNAYCQPIMTAYLDLLQARVL